MPTKTLNPRFIETVTTKKSQEDFFDALCAGLAIRVTDKGKKTWCFTFTPPGETWSKRARLTLGTYPALELADARTAAEAARAAVQSGKDPRNIVAKPVEKTIRELIDDRIRLQVRPDAENYLRSCMDIERIYDNHVIPVVGDVMVKDFDVSDLNRVLDPIVERGALIMANRVFSEMKSLLKFGVRRGEIKYSPLSEFEPPNEENARERFLSLPEIKTFWERTPVALVRSRNAQLVLKLCLATGKRINEVCGMKRQEVNAHTRLWTIPKSRVKGRNKKARDELVPLSDLALSLFLEAMRGSNSDWVFPNEEDDGPHTPAAIDKTVACALEPTDTLPLGRYGMVKWTPHDLRRTVGTQMLAKANGLRISKEDKYLALNHTSGMKKNVSDRVYDQNEYLDEKREALEKWGNFLAALVGENVQQREAA